MIGPFQRGDNDSVLANWQFQVFSRLAHCKDWTCRLLCMIMPTWNSMGTDGERVGNSQPSIRTTRAAQLPLLIPSLVPRPSALEPKGVVYTKRWVVELLLDLAGYTQ